MKPLAGKTILVTGGARRLGRAVALAAAEAGADVVLTYRSSTAEAVDTVARLQALGVKATALACDLRRPDTVSCAVEQAAQFTGQLDLLVNNAGYFETVDLETLSVEAWDRMFEINTRGPWLMARACLPWLRRSQAARIVNLGSLGGLRPWPTHAHYCASKSALHMLTLTMARAFAPQVSVNAVAPGMVQMNEKDTTLEHLAARTPMLRNGTPSDVAQAVLFFLTGPAFITGQILAVDGGLSLV